MGVRGEGEGEGVGEGEGECDEGLRLGAGFGWGHLGEAAVVHGLERVPVRHLHTDEVLQPERGEFERAHAPAADQGEVVELVAEHLSRRREFEYVRQRPGPTAGELALLEGRLDPRAPPAGAAHVAAQHLGLGLKRYSVTVRVKVRLRVRVRARVRR